MMEMKEIEREFTASVLPSEIWISILHQIPFLQLIRLASVSTAWRVLVPQSVTSFDGHEGYWLTSRVITPRISGGLGFVNLTALEFTSQYGPLAPQALHHLAKLTCLNISSNSKLTNDHISHFNHLRTLEISNGMITNSGLRGMTALETLGLSFNSNITDAALTELTRHTTLRLVCNEAITPRGYSILTNLTSLDLEGVQHQCNDETLCVLTNLVFLRLSDSVAITDVSMRVLTKLTQLSLTSMRRITDESLTCLHNLTSLELCGQRTLTADGLSVLSKLAHLSILVGCRLISDGLWKLTQITSLSLEGCEISSSINSLTNLRSLSLNHTGLANAVFSNLVNLTSLTLKNIKYIINVGTLTALSTLAVSQMAMSDESLASLTNLTTLNMMQCGGVSNLALARATKLTMLSIEGCDFSDEGISHLTNLTELYVGAQISDEGISGLTNLTSIRLAFCDSRVKSITLDGLNHLRNLRSVSGDYSRYLKNLFVLDVDKGNPFRSRFY